MVSLPDSRPEVGPEFAQRVLDRSPSPLIVVDAMGQIVYGNRAMADVSGWPLHDMIGTSILSHIHPDDVDRVTEGFLAVTDDITSSEPDVAWSAIHFRVFGHDGQVIPLEVIGASALDDDVVEGVIYNVRPVHTHDLLHRTLIGSATGEDVDTLLGHVAATITAPPVELFAAILEPLEDLRGSNGYRVLASTDERFAAALRRADSFAVPWDRAVDEPERIRLAELDARVRDALTAVGVVDAWHVAAQSSTGNVSYRIVTAAPIFHVPDIGVRDRMREAKELAAVVLLRAETDALLEHAATHDQLTGLLNRAGFTTRASAVADELGAGAVLFLDLDGFKPINDQHGHRAGDAVLRILGDRLRRTARSSDLIGRVGGDEFAVLLRAGDGRKLYPADAYATAERMLSAIAEPITLDEDVLDTSGDRSGAPGRRADDAHTVEVEVTASVGVAMLDGSTSFDTLLQRADDAMYRAKRAGGDRPELV